MVSGRFWPPASEYTVNHRPGRGPGRQILVSVAKSKNDLSGSNVNYRPGRNPGRRFPDRVVRSGNRPRLSPGKGAKVVPKVPYFAGRPVAGSPRLRAPAPWRCGSSIGSPFSGCSSGDPNFDGKTRQIRHFGPLFSDSVENSDGKRPFGSRMHKNGHRFPWYFPKSHQAKE